MTISLKYGSTTLQLDPDLYWLDEYQHSGVQQSVDRGLTGALIVQVDGSAASPGREITLQPQDDDSAWMIRADVDTLQAWSQIAGAQFELTLRGVVYPVIFRNHDKPAVDAKPVVHFSDAQAGDYYLVTLKFLTI